MVVLLFPSYFIFIAYCKTIVSCISLYFCMIWSDCYSLHVFSHIFGYYDYNFHCIITLDLAFIVRYIFLHCCLKKKYFPTTNTDSPPGQSISPIPQRWGIKKHFYLSSLPHGLPWFWDLSVQFSSVAQSCLTLCDPMNHSTPGLPVHHQLPEFTQTHVHRVSDAIQPSHPLSSPSPLAPNPSQHQSLFRGVNSSHEVAKILEFQL